MKTHSFGTSVVVSKTTEGIPHFKSTGVALHLDCRRVHLISRLKRLLVSDVSAVVNVKDSIPVVLDGPVIEASASYNVEQSFPGRDEGSRKEVLTRHRDIPERRERIRKELGRRCADPR